MKKDPYFKFISGIVLSGVALSLFSLSEANVAVPLSEITTSTATTPATTATTLQATTAITEASPMTPPVTNKPQPRHRRHAKRFS